MSLKTYTYTQCARLALLAVALLPSTVKAAFHFTLTETGAGVELIGSGKFDISGLNVIQTLGGEADGARLTPFDGFLAMGVGEFSLFDPEGFTGPQNIGTGDFFIADSGDGDVMGFGLGVQSDSLMAIAVPYGYVSGTELSASAFFEGESFDTMGLTIGTYTWTTEAGAQDTITVSVVPEPSTWAMVAGLGALVVCLFRRRV